MWKRFKLRFSVQFCRSKHNATKQTIYKLSSAFNPKTLDITYRNFPNPPPSTPIHPPIERHVSSNTVSNGSGYSSCNTESPTYTWTKITDDEMPRRKVYRPSTEYGDTDDDIAMTPLLKSENRKDTKTKKKSKKINVRNRTSTSSGDSGWFTSEEISSRSFSNESSNDQSKDRKPEKTKLPANSSPVRMTSVFRRVMSPCKVRESIAVEKKSEDPYGDFRRSMMEMIMEKQLFEVKELEELLRCFLELNSKHHHGVIVEVFTEIWVSLFSSSGLV